MSISCPAAAGSCFAPASGRSARLAFVAAVCLVFVGTPTAVQADCGTDAQCLKSATAAQIIHAQVRDPYVYVNDMPSQPPADAAMRLAPGTDQWLLDLTATSYEMPRFTPNFSPIAGFTIAVKMYLQPYGPDDPTRSIWAFSGKGAEAALGLRGNTVLFGRSGSWDTSDWVPLWNPSLPPTGGWVVLFATFKADGKLLVDGFSAAKFAKPRWEQSLIETGMPLIGDFPDGRDPKTLMTIDQIRLGTQDQPWAIKAPAAGGFNQMYIFNRELSAGERRAVYNAYLAIPSTAPLWIGDFPCNTGTYLSQAPFNTPFQSAISTPCGERYSPLAQALANGTYIISSAPDHTTATVWDVLKASKDPGAQIQAYRWNGQNNQRWTVELLRDNYYKIVSVNSRLAATTMDQSGDESDTVLQQPVAAGGPSAAQYWRLIRLGPNSEPAEMFRVENPLVGSAVCGRLNVDSGWPLSFTANAQSPCKEGPATQQWYFVRTTDPD